MESSRKCESLNGSLHHWEKSQVVFLAFDKVLSIICTCAWADCLLLLFELVGVSAIRHRVVSNHHFPLQFVTMDKIHREVLGKNTIKIMGRISSPKVFSSFLREIFSAADVEEIAAKEAQKGPTHGTQTMLSILEKRGPKAYGLFINVLRDSENRLGDLADDLEDEESKLRGKTGISFMDLITLNTIEISNYSHARYLVRWASRRFLHFRRLLLSTKTTRFLPKYILNSFLNFLKAIEPK